MDKNSIKKYAVWARRELIERVTQKALKYGITVRDHGDPKTDSVGGHLLSDTEKKQRAALISKIKEQGFGQVMEEAAYTWFNRFTALRFMEVNGYLPSRVRVFTDADNNFNPQILAEAIDLELDGLDMEKVYSLKDANKKEELFKYILIVQCNALSNVLPVMFQTVDDYTELLLPDYLLRDGSVIQQMIELIPEEDWKDQVQIIGWLYQYYNTELKEKVFADLKKNIKITRENIPVATQLFTPDWIVRYMVENSLGRLWLEGHPNDSLKAEWKYYLDEAEQEADVQKRLGEIRKGYAALTPEDILCIDPCMGSGHILCYLFDIFIRIYGEYGYTAQEAVPLIIEKNLWGLDIDERAAQIAYFSVMMKARQYDKRFLVRKDENGKPDIPQPHVHCPKDYDDGEEFGSLITVEELEPMPHETKEITLFAEKYERQLNRWNFRRALAQKYHVVVTNPPYMGVGNMNGKLSEFIKKNYPDSKSDLFACFINRGFNFLKPNGYNCMVTMQSWMFLSSFEKMRTKLLSRHTLSTLMHMENMVMGIAFGTAVSIFRVPNIVGYKGTYNHIQTKDIQNDSPAEFPVPGNRFAQISSDNFSKIPGSPIAYWLTPPMFRAFQDGVRLGQIADSKQGIATANNNHYLRLWFEVSRDNIKLDTASHEDAAQAKEKWYPYNKGGEFRKWYGNNDFVVNWQNDGLELRGDKKAVLRNPSFYFKPCFSWSLVSSSVAAFRYKPSGHIFDVAGMSCFSKEHLFFLLGLCNSKVVMAILKVIAPTINYQCGDIANIPVIWGGNDINVIESMVKQNVEISKQDWDYFECSWDFEGHPLIKIGLNRINRDEEAVTVEECFRAWSHECDDRFQTLKTNEEELNRIFIDIYGLQDELTPEVEDKDVTVRKANLGRDIRSLISYAVGCMFGRYSLDGEGLAYAGGEWDATKYKTFPPEKDAILPISDDEYFSDDILGRFVEFVRVVYGDNTLEENLQFIADALGGKGSSRAVIRNYFINNFYADHCKIYQKRPIYWLFDSGKKNGFKCLVYMHRYQPDTIARIRTDYVHEQQSRYRTAIAGLEQRINGVSAPERVKLNKALSKLKDQEAELRKYEEKIHHLADQMIPIDLDDGIKHNYEIFKDVLAKLK